MSASNVNVSRAASATDRNTTDREIVITRVFDAPRELLFRAWTDPKHIVRWFGPNGFTTTIHEMDVRPGGVWRLTMRGPDGRDYRNRIVFLEVARPERLVYKHEPEPGSEPVSFETTVTFIEEGGGTRLTMRQLFPTAAARNEVAEKYHAIEGGKQTLGRLAEHLARISGKTSFAVDAAARTVTMTRVFDAPRELVFAAYTEPRHIPRWFGRRRHTTIVDRMEVRPGGGWRFVSRDPGGAEYAFHGEYREVVPPERLVYTFEYEGMPGHVVVDTVVFNEQEGGTAVTVTAEFTTREDLDGMIQSGMETGAKESWDRMAELLAEA